MNVTMEKDLRRAYGRCRRMQLRHDPTFFWATSRLPLEELGVYMDSMRVDCGRVRIASRDELDRYMNGSAAAVGRLMAPLLGSDAPEEVARLGVAFQLTNFIRDVREDYA